MPRIIEVLNVLQKNRGGVENIPHSVSEGSSLLQWASVRYPDCQEVFPVATLCIKNGSPFMRKHWDKPLGKNDVVEVVPLPGTPVQALWVVVALLVVSTVILAASIKAPPTITRGQTPEADPVYTLKGQRNQVRLGEPIESAYGRVRVWPSYAAAAYNKYQNNEQWQYQLLSLGHGYFDIEAINIEDTPVSSYTDVEYEIVEPNGTVSLFPDNVVTSVEVSNIELFAPNEPEANAEWVEDSPGDVGLGIPATGHYGYSDPTPFVVNPSGTVTELIEIDIGLPRGLYKSNNSGGIDSLAIEGLFEAQQIDDAGTPVGAWFTIATFSKTLATVTPQRYTLSAEVASGRYQVRGSRTNNKDTSAGAGNTLIWEAVRAFLPSERDYGGVTLLAIKLRATNNINDNAANRVNVVATRKLPIWNGSVWSAPTATRSIVWAFCDIFRATYGGNLSDSFLNLPALLALDTFFAGRSEYFDWIFDQKLTVWEAARLVANVGRAVPMLNGSQITMVRDDVKTVPTAIFNQENMVEHSFRWEMKLASLDAKDGIRVEYTNPTTWKIETVDCLVGDDSGEDMETIRLNGVTSRQHAYNWGRWKRAISRYQRENVSFRTGLEGHIPSYGDLITICHDVPRWGQGGFVLSVDGTTLELSEPVSFGVGTHKILLRKRNGESTAALTVTAGADDYHVVLDSALTIEDFCFDDNSEKPLFVFGPSTQIARDCKIVSLAPGEDDTVDVTAIPYRSEVYSQDDTAPGGGDNGGNLPNIPGVDTSIKGLIVVASPYVANEVIATWNAVRGASYYVVELSYNGTTWERVADRVEDTNVRFTVVSRSTMYVRVAPVTVGQGSWTYWVGTAPVDTYMSTYTSYIFIRADTQPATPTGNNPAGWSDAPPTTDPEKPLWVSKAEFYTATDTIVDEWTEPVNIKGDDGVTGDNGESVYVEFSIDGVTDWHDDYTEGDIYMRQKIGLEGTWSDPIKVVGEDGVDGEDGGFFDYRFKRSATQPATPTGDTPAGWYDSPPAADGYPLWMTRGFKDATGSLVGTWSTPAQIEGDSIFIQYSVDGSTSWHDTFTTGDKYMRQKVGVNGTWSGPIKIVGEDGAAGGTSSLTIYWHPSGLGGGYVNGAYYSGSSSTITGLSPGLRVTIEADSTVSGDNFLQYSGPDVGQFEAALSSNPNTLIMAGNLTVYADY